MAGMEDLDSPEIWRDAFHWKQLVRFDIFLFLVAGAPSIGGILLFFDQFTLAAICFAFTGLLIVGRIIYFAFDHKDSVRRRVVFAAVSTIIFGGATLWSVWGTLSYARNKESATHIPAPSQPKQPEQRSLTDYQRTQLKAIFSRTEYRGQTVVILVSGGDESWAYAGEVATLFDGWKALGPFHADKNELAMDVQVSSSNLLPPPSQIPQMVLSSFQLVQIKGRSNLIRDPDVPPNVTVVWVGPKGPDGTTPDNRVPESTHLQEILKANSVTLGPTRPPTLHPPVQPSGVVASPQPDPDKEILAAAQKLQFNLCNFQQEWELQYQADKSQATKGEPGGQLNPGEFRWLKSQHYPEKSKRYADDYQSDAMTLRAKLIREVPGVAIQYADDRYGAVQTPDDIDVVYWDFHNLVLAFNTKLSTGTYQQIVDPDYPNRPATCKPLLGIQAYTKLPSGSYIPAPEPQ
jgi:hypothetical protein